MTLTSISKRLWAFFGLVTVLVVAQLVGRAQQPTSVDVSQLMIPPDTLVGLVAPPTGLVEVWVGLIDPALSQANGPNAKRTGGRMNREQQRDYSRGMQASQDSVVARVTALGGREIARVRKAHNAVAFQIDASRIPEISALPGVRSVRPVRNYAMDLSSTVPYIGAAAVQATGIDGSGVTVAVLDSGIDYTHRNLGGAGTAAAYLAAYGTAPADVRNTTRDGLFPTAKVIGGYDFVGERWPNQPLAPDDDPIDFEGHGTHVADIIAGHSLDDTHRGVAPGASLMAFKVCSAVATSCSGVALLQGMDAALDPNGDDDLSDAVDVINMSLGSNYGQEQDDLSEASAVAVESGVVVVAAAGNAADRPYIVSSPSTGLGVISVAQTQVPTAGLIPLQVNSPAAIAGLYTNTATLDFAPVTGTVTGNVAYVGRGCAGDPYLANPAGKIALIDRGVCAISLKVDRAALAGATGVLIGLVAAGDATSFSYGGGTTFVPSLVITQSTSNLIKANLAAPVNATISTASTIPLVGSVVGSSARGPSYDGSTIKPDIAAPGASVSAIAGTGTGEDAFGGTSGATPMVAGSAALLLQAHPGYIPNEIRALLMNTAETNIFTNPGTLPGVLAPVTRIGAGEVRVNRALASKVAAWDTEHGLGSLSFGYEAATSAVTITRRMYVLNYADNTRTFNLSSGFRYANDAASGAVTVSLPSTLSVPAHAKRSFSVVLRISPSLLPTWNLNGGSQGGNGPLLQGVEFDGYLTIADAIDTIHVPWHVLPHKSAAVTPDLTRVTLVGGTGSLTLTNPGAVSGRFDVFALTGTSPTMSPGELPLPGSNFAVVDLKAVGVRLVSAGTPAIQFAINTNGARAHPNYPAEFDVYIDSNRDGNPDFAVFNSENGGFGATGQNVVSVVNLTTNAVVTRFFADADLNSGNFIATALLSDLGLTPSSQFDFGVYAFDNYFTGALTDSIEGMTYTPASPRFIATGAGPVPVNGSTVLTIQEVPGGATASPSQTGVLLMYRDAKDKKESSVVKVK